MKVRSEVPGVSRLKREGNRSPDAVIKHINTYAPLEWQVEPWHDITPILLLSGSAGGGKSRLAAEKIHGFMLRYPGAMGLIMRKNRTSLPNTAIAFMKKTVIGSDPRVKHRPSKSRFEYDNGSLLAYSGMYDDRDRERIRSIGQDGGLDIVWMEEATQFEEEDFNEVLARMRGRAAPWTQIILATNPDGPGHWINIRLILGGEASVYYSGVYDNPNNPDGYVESLKKLSGVQYKRLVLGEWAAGSGRIFDTWSDEFNAVNGKDHGGNVTLDAEYRPEAGPVIWAIDDGYSGVIDKKTRMFSGKSHPRAILFCQIKQNGQIAVFGESYKIQTLASDHLKQALELSARNGWPRPMYVVRDRAAASLDGALQNISLRSRYNAMTVDESTKELRQMLNSDENGYRHIIVHPRCFYLRYEMLTYSFDNDGRVIKEHDHGPDCLRYLAWELAYGKPSTVDIATIDDVVLEYMGEVL